MTRDYVCPKDGTRLLTAPDGSPWCATCDLAAKPVRCPACGGRCVVDENYPNADVCWRCDGWGQLLGDEPLFPTPDRFKDDDTWP